MEAVEENGSPIQRFYKDKNVFITGGTGFLGKILIEKLLRSTDVATIYILVRYKKGKDIHLRVDELLDDAVFSKLKQHFPKYKQRVLGIRGDCSMDGLGLSINDRKFLIKKVNVVFNVAATVHFDESLKLAYAINVNGTKYLMDLCFQLENLKSVIHVSSTYANCHVDKIDEVFYHYSVDYDEIGQVLSNLGDEEIKQNTPSILGNWPNTYTFTKALAEALIKDKCRGLPIGVFRPAIVISTYKEPIEGWIDNFYGPTGAIVAVFLGLLRTMNCKEDNIANIVPVDICVAGLISASWEVAHQESERVSENVKIYNYVSSPENPLTWQEYTSLSMLYGNAYPFSTAIWSIFYDHTSNKHINRFRKFMLHYIPAAFLDVFLVLTGRKPKLLATYWKMNKYITVIEYFSTRNWSFTNDNVQSLYNNLNPADKELFPMSVQNLIWLDYFKNYMRGIRQYLIKDPMETLEAAKMKQKRFHLMHTVLKYLIGILAANCIRSLLHRAIQNRLKCNLFREIWIDLL